MKTNKAKRILILGDIHGDWRPVRRLYQDHPYSLQKTDNTLILLGDAGLNFFFNHRDEETKKKLGRYPFTYFVIRGNHEQRPSICMEQEPEKWHIEEYWSNGVYVENDYPYIKYALDEVAIYNAETEVGSYKTLVIPGAYSVDKYRRLQMGWSWFPAEQLTEEEMERGKALIERNPAFDLVLSHTCPIIYEPTDLFLSVVDQSMVDKSMERYLGEIEYKLNYKLWVFGHYHADRIYPKVNKRGQMIMVYHQAIDLQNWINGNINIDIENFL